MQILPPQIDRLSMLMQEGNAGISVFGVPFGGNAGLGCPGHFLCHFKTVIPILMPLAVNRDKPIKNFKVMLKSALLQIQTWEEKRMKIIMLGAPGAGKGTQAKQIAAKYEIPHISTGDIFRANIKEGTELGKKAKAFMDKGELVPDELTCDLVVDRISKPDAAKGYVLDGFPRTIPQAEALTKALEARGEKIDYAINVEVPDENIVHRMGGRRACIGCGATYHVEFNAPKVEDVCDTCGGELVLRDDDKPETVQKRLSVYHAQTQPLIDYYKKANVLVEVDGTQDINVVFQDIVKILGA